jgi:hypothetical protein
MGHTIRNGQPMSALPPKADIETQPCPLCAKADILRCGKECRCSTTSSARASSQDGTSSLKARLIIRQTRAVVSMMQAISDLHGRANILKFAHLPRMSGSHCGFGGRPLGISFAAYLYSKLVMLANSPWA